MPNFIDITGERFGKLVVLIRAENHILPSGKPRTMWHCKCECGKETDVSSQGLRQGTTTSCGCLRNDVFKKPVIDIVGKKYGKLTVEKQMPSKITQSGQRKTMWKCQCECGGTVIVEGSQLKSGKTQSCGCLKSKMERDIAEFLSKYHIDFVKEKSFADLKTPKGGLTYFDFAIYKDGTLVALIEAQGIQHYREDSYMPEFGKYEREITDPLKREYCRTNHIPLCEIAYSDNLEYEMLSFLIELHANTVPSPEGSGKV